MNIAERHIASYIVTALTGIEGEDFKFTKEYLEKTKVVSKNPLLSLVSTVVRAGDSEFTREFVAGLVLGYAVHENKDIRDMLEQVIMPWDEELTALEQKPKHRAVYSTDNHLVCVTVWNRDDVLQDAMFFAEDEDWKSKVSKKYEGITYINAK